MADITKAQSIMLVSLPEDGGVAEYQMASDMPVKFTFFVTEVLFSCDGNDLLLTGEQGGVVVFKDYLTMAQDGSLPSFELHGGEQVPGDIYLFAFNEGAMSVETAAGTPDESSEMEEFLDDVISHGNLLHDPAHTFEDGTSFFDHVSTQSHAQSISIPLSCADIFPDHHYADVAFTGTEHVTPLLGVPLILPDDVATCSLAGGYDPIDDVIQLMVDSRHYF